MNKYRIINTQKAKYPTMHKEFANLWKFNVNNNADKRCLREVFWKVRGVVEVLKTIANCLKSFNKR